MSLFCLLWIPVFYFFIRSTGVAKESKSGWALFFGGLTALSLILFGEFSESTDFGISRWFYGFIDIVSVPALLPFIIWLFLAAIKKISFKTDSMGFALLWLIPLSIYRAADWSSLGTPVMLVLVPALWTIQICSLSFFIECIMQKPKWYVIVPACIGIIAVPLIAATSWWEFFSSKYLSGYLFLFAVSLPALISLIFRARKQSLAEKPLLLTFNEP